VRYVERNALRAGLVERAEDWPWGSLHQRARKAGGPLLGDWRLPEPSDWTEHVNTPQTEAELQAIRRPVRRGSPYGSAFWTEQTAKQLALESTPARSRPPSQRIAVTRQIVQFAQYMRLSPLFTLLFSSHQPPSPVE